MITAVLREIRLLISNTCVPKDWSSLCQVIIVAQFHNFYEIPWK